MYTKRENVQLTNEEYYVCVALKVIRVFIVCKNVCIVEIVY